MKDSNNKNLSAVIIYGPPGAGKGTQAQLLADRFNLIHFDTGKYGEQVIYNPSLRNDSLIQRQRKLFETGFLFDPAWTLNLIYEKIQKLFKAGFSAVITGSPRTLFEAKGDKKQEGLLKLLEELYGKKNILAFRLMVSPQTSILRNSRRLVCPFCGAMPIKFKKPNCPICGGKLRHRVLDKPEIIKVRLKEYQGRTEPIFKLMKSRGYNFFDINGEPLPFEVFKQIEKKYLQYLRKTCSL